MGTSEKKERVRDKKRRTNALGSWGQVKKKARDKIRRTKALGSWERVPKKESEREIKRGGLRRSVVGGE